jgi:hypothetical protein
VKVYWILFYWISFASSLIAMPLFIYYYQSSELERVYKLRYAVKTLIIWSFLPACLGVLGWCYLYFNGLVTISNTPQIIIALSNA